MIKPLSDEALQSSMSVFGVGKTGWILGIAEMCRDVAQEAQRDTLRQVVECLQKYAEIFETTDGLGHFIKHERVVLPPDVWQELKELANE